MTEGAALYLGVDGGGTKTALTLIDSDGEIRATHLAPGAYYITIGLDALGTLLADAVSNVLAKAALRAADLDFAFFGLPAYGEDSALVDALSRLPERCLPAGRYGCGNDMICGWAGSLLCGDGISIVAGTGSICYGERRGAVARSGGWGELFSDEGSAYWIACRGLNLFSRMSDGRAARGPLYEIVRRSAGIAEDLDLCAHIFTGLGGDRARIAQLCQWMTQAARAGDAAALDIVRQAAAELALMVDATRTTLGIHLRRAGAGFLLGRRLRQRRRADIGAFRRVAAGASLRLPAQQTRAAAVHRRRAVCGQVPWPALVEYGDRAPARAERGIAARSRAVKVSKS